MLTPFFTEDFGKGVMLPGSRIFANGTGWSCDFQSLLFLFTQMEKEDSIHSLLSSLMVDLTKMLCNPTVWKQHIPDLAKRCSLQTWDSMVVFIGRYLLNFLSCHLSLFSLHEQVNSIRITFLVELESKTIPLHSWVKATWAGKEYWSCGSVNNFQSNAWCKMPIWDDFLQAALAPFLTNLIKSFGFSGTDLISIFCSVLVWLLIVLSWLVHDSLLCLFPCSFFAFFCLWSL